VPAWVREQLARLAMKPTAGIWGMALMAFALLTALPSCEAISGRETTGEYVDDATITTRVKTALARDPEVKAREVNVETFRNEVQLSGFVGTREEAAKAARIAAQVPGVRVVRNNIAVR
jgi:hyperosmotically inducible periplasmic protein